MFLNSFKHTTVIDSTKQKVEKNDKCNGDLSYRPFRKNRKKKNFQLYNHSLGMERRMIFPSSDICSVSSNTPILLLLQLCCIWSLVRLAHVACSQCLDCGDLMTAPFSVVRLQDEHNRFTGPSCFLEVHKAEVTL